MVILYIIAAYAIGYYIGKRMGMALVMMRVQTIFDDLEKIQQSLKQWTEDDL